MIKMIIFSFILFLIPLNSFGGQHHERGFRERHHYFPERMRPERPPYRIHGNGYIDRPVRFYPGRSPRGIWRGDRFYYENHTYYLWSWGPATPFYGWAYYDGWRTGLYYYFPDGIKCISDNPEVPGEWSGRTSYYYSDDAINSSLGACESDSEVYSTRNESKCRIKTCVRW